MKKVCFQLNFEWLFWRCIGNEFKSDGPARAKARSPKTYYMQG